MTGCIVSSKSLNSSDRIKFHQISGKRHAQCTHYFPGKKFVKCQIEFWQVSISREKWNTYYVVYCLRFLYIINEVFSVKSVYFSEFLNNQRFLLEMCSFLTYLEGSHLKCICYVSGLLVAYFIRRLGSVFRTSSMFTVPFAVEHQTPMTFVPPSPF